MPRYMARARRTDIDPAMLGCLRLIRQAEAGNVLPRGTHPKPLPLAFYAVITKRHMDCR